MALVLPGSTQTLGFPFLKLLLYSQPLPLENFLVSSPSALSTESQYSPDLLYKLAGPPLSLLQLPGRHHGRGVYVHARVRVRVLHTGVCVYGNSTEV